jgi:hypothetical protein
MARSGQRAFTVDHSPFLFIGLLHGAAIETSNRRWLR